MGVAFPVTTTNVSPLGETSNSRLSWLSWVTDDIGLFVSSGGFTSDAQLEARTQEKRHLTLLDRKKLFDLWVEHYAKIPEERRQLLPLRPVYFLSPKD